MLKRTKVQLLKIKVLHSLPGRMRITSAAVKYLGSEMKQVIAGIAGTKGIKKAEYSPVTGNILIEYDPEGASLDKVLETAEDQLGAYSLLAYQRERESRNIPVVNERRLQDASAADISKRILIAGFSLAFFGLRQGIGITGLAGWRSNLFSAPALISLALSQDIFKSGIKTLFKSKRPNADTLTTTAIATALLTGRSTSALVTILLSDIAEFMTAYTMEKTRNAIGDMLNTGDEEVFVLMEDGRLQRKPISEVKKQDIVSLQTGDKLSVDGEVIEGEAYIDESSITGEFFPARKGKSNPVYAGTIVKSGQLRVRVSRIGDDTTVARIVQMVEDAASKKAHIQTYADRLSAKLIPVNFVLALLMYAYTGNINRALSMMIIDFSCGVRLSTATALSACIYNAARNGVLIKGGNYVEELAEADSLVLDKTGTVTEGKPKVNSVIAADGVEERYLLAVAAAAEEDSSHPMAAAILSHVRRKGISIPRHSLTSTEAGMGISTVVGEETILVGSRRFMKQKQINIKMLEPAAVSLEQKGEMVVYVAGDSKCLGIIGIHDSLKENMKKALNRLRNMGFDDIRLLTGDLAFHAERVASRMNMDDFQAELMPEDKAHAVLSMQSLGGRVIMIGDGINDAPALAYADAGIAIGNTRTDVAIESASITITNDDPLLIPSVVQLSRSTMKTIKENFAIVIGINSIGIFLSALGILPVIWGSVLHNSSTIFVVLNSGRILIKDIERRYLK